MNCSHLLKCIPSLQPQEKDSRESRLVVELILSFRRQKTRTECSWDTRASITQGGWGTFWGFPVPITSMSVVITHKKTWYEWALEEMWTYTGMFREPLVIPLMLSNHLSLVFSFTNTFNWSWQRGGHSPYVSPLLKPSVTTLSRVGCFVLCASPALAYTSSHSLSWFCLHVLFPQGDCELLEGRERCFIHLEITWT